MPQTKQKKKFVILAIDGLIHLRCWNVVGSHMRELIALLIVKTP